MFFLLPLIQTHTIHCTVHVRTYVCGEWCSGAGCVMCVLLCPLLQLLADLQGANAKVAQLSECLERRESELGGELKAALTKGEEQQQR